MIIDIQGFYERFYFHLPIIQCMKISQFHLNQSDMADCNQILVTNLITNIVIRFKYLPHA